MTCILLPIDGSPVSLRVVEALVARQPAASAIIHLVNVQRPVSRDVGQFVSHDALRDYHRDEGLKALAEARGALKAAGIVAIPHVLVGDDPAAVILQFARDNGVDEIIMGSRGRGRVAEMLLGSVARAVSRDAGLPVTLIR